MRVHTPEHCTTLSCTHHTHCNLGSFENEARVDLETAQPTYLTDPPRAQPRAGSGDVVENVLVVTESGQDFAYAFKPELSVR